MYGTQEIYSGSSGGTIRLMGRKVVILSSGRLEVDGSPAGTRWNISKYQLKGLYGGAGGVVQIIAESGKIEPGTISLKPGANYPLTGPSSGPGFLLIRDYSGNMYNIWNTSWSFPNSTFTWETQKKSVACNISSAKICQELIVGEELTDGKIQDIQSWISCLEVNKALGQNKDLVLRNGDILTIDTTVPIAHVQQPIGVPVSNSYNIIHRNGVPVNHGQNDWCYTYAELVFDGIIKVEPGSIVNVTGKYGLSIKSLNGNITIGSDINMTCAVNATGMEMCLGGYAPPLDNPYSNRDFLPGNGPGGSIVVGQPYLIHYSFWAAAGHGGQGRGCDDTALGSPGLTYEQENIYNLIGGSTGTSLNRPIKASMPGSGGGAIELKADNGTITIAASISASAQRLYGTQEIYSGSSGGTIRLMGRKVAILSSGRLEVDGGPAGTRWSISKCQYIGLYGGAGGVVQIIAESGKIEPGTISLKPGANYPLTGPSSGPGFLLIRDYSGNMYNIWNTSWSFPNSTFTWETQKRSFACNISSAKICQELIAGEELTDGKIQDIQSWISCLENESDSINSIDFSGSIECLMDILYHVVSNNYLTRFQIARSVEALKRIILTTAIHHWDLFFSISRIVDRLLDPHNRAARNDSKMITMLDLMDEVSEIAAKRMTLQSTPGSATRLNYTGTNMAIQILKYNQADFKGVSLSMNTDDQTTGTTNRDQVILHRESFATHLTNTGYVSFVVKVYNDVEDIFPKTFGSSVRLDQATPSMSHMISVTILVNKKVIRVLSGQVLINFVLLTPSMRESIPHCVYWNKSLNSWNNDGVELELFSGTHVQCSTNHLTSFAVLFSNTNAKIPERHAFALHLLTYICCGLSIAALFITLIIFYSIEALSSDRHRIHMHLALSILLSQLLFLIGIDATEHKILCSIVAGCLHYLFLTSFSWMCVEGVHLYMKIVRVYRTESIRMMHYYIFGWGFPVIYVGIAVAVNSSGYGTEAACWLSLENSFIWVFIGPAVIIAMINLVILVMVIKVVITSADILESQRARIMSGVKGVSVLLPLLGVTWVFGLLVVHDNSIVFQYIFTVTNSLQGLFIFTFHCVGNTEVRTALRRFREKTFDFNSIFSPSDADAVVSVSRKSPKDRKLREKLKETKVYPLKNISSSVESQASQDGSQRTRTRK